MTSRCTLIDRERMSTRPTGTIDNFNAVYDFKTVLQDQFSS